jgi:hypothetical protein
LASIFNGLSDGAKSAKPLCVGSIPTRASKIYSFRINNNCHIAQRFVLILC